MRKSMQRSVAESESSVLVRAVQLLQEKVPSSQWLSIVDFFFPAHLRSALVFCFLFCFLLLCFWLIVFCMVVQGPRLLPVCSPYLFQVLSHSLNWERECRIISEKVLQARPGSGMCHVSLYQSQGRSQLQGRLGDLINLYVKKEKFIDLMSIQPICQGG